jgi:hypothetical protein
VSLCCAFIRLVVFVLTEGAAEGCVAALAGAATPVSACAISQCSARCLPASHPSAFLRPEG